jgi:hypothetical protein
MQRNPEGRHMKRRSLFLGGIAIAIVGKANAATRMLGQTPLGPAKRVFVQQPAVIRQQCPEWCWAASSAMIFAMHGHPVNQLAIVSRVFGGLACMSGQGITIAEVLSASWMDDNGRPFQSQVTAAYDFGDGILAINNRVIIDELANNRPLLYGNQHHAMVVGQIDYIETQMGPRIQAVGVFDPWPGSPPFHNLMPAEMVPQHMGGQMGFLAAVQI